MELMIIAAWVVLLVGVSFASTCDMHSCTNCKNTGSTEFGMMRVAEGKKTIRNPRGLYYTHSGCVKN